MKYGFVTCVQLGLSCMEAIYESGGKLDLVMTLKDEQAVNKSGRVYLDDFCSVHGIELIKSTHVNNTDVIEAIKLHKLDWLFIIGWSQIAKDTVLHAPKFGVLGMHPTLLPVGRGRAAIPWAILKGLNETGVTMFKLDSGIDSGEIIDQIIIPLSPHITATELYGKVNIAHATLMKQVFHQLQLGTATFRSQDESLVSEWPGRSPEDGAINMDGSVYDAERLVRGITRPYPGAFIFRNGCKIIVWKSEVLNATDIKESEFCISFKDGVLRCLEWEVV
ncbi:MAG: methionyl-tRNA formyltransferase [Chlorobiaceae bacterium]|nr:methionyl-tRNA formyltransferase [Chlorobiaceae bacterium]